MATDNSDEGDRVMWVGNLDSRVTEELLWELFVQAGPLDSVKIRTGKVKNFAFVTFQHQASVPYAIDLMNDIRLFDSNLCLRFRNKSVGNGPDMSEGHNSPYQHAHNGRDDYYLPPPNGWQVHPNMMMISGPPIHSAWGHYTLDAQQPIYSQEYAGGQDWGWDGSQSPYLGRRDNIMRRAYSSPSHLLEEGGARRHHDHHGRPRR